ncbi:uncharacterized protein METZ01_LOCUS153543, partial [marine metagenome]
VGVRVSPMTSNSLTNVHFYTISCKVSPSSNSIFLTSFQVSVKG